MDINADKKSQITLELLKDLVSEIKGSAGSRLKPKAVEVEIESKPIALEGEEHDDIEEKSPEGLKDHLDSISKEEIPEEDLESLMDDEGAEEDQPKEEESLASRRLSKRMR
jgi:uncharacterized membrane-anchored protein